MQHSSSLKQQSLTCRNVLQLLRELIRQRPEYIREGIKDELLGMHVSLHMWKGATDSLTLDFRARRKALQLLRELMRQRPEDIRETVKEGLLRTLVAAVKSDQPDVREAALALLALLVQHPGLVTVAKQVSCICALG